DDFLPGEPAVSLAETFPCEAAAAFEDDVERLALDVLHDEEGSLLVPAGADQADDIRVLELLEDVGFALEPLDCRLVAQKNVRDHLQGDALARRAVHRAEDGAHRAAAQFPLDVERADLFADQHTRSARGSESRVVFLPLTNSPTPAIVPPRGRGKSES